MAAAGYSPAAVSFVSISAEAPSSLSLIHISGGGRALHRHNGPLRFAREPPRQAAVRPPGPAAPALPPDRDPRPRPVQPRPHAHRRQRRHRPRGGPGARDKPCHPDTLPAHEEQPRPRRRARRGQDLSLIHISLPVVSATGVECACMPTALFSTHTGEFTGWTFRDLTDQMLPMARHWHSIGAVSYTHLYYIPSDPRRQYFTLAARRLGLRIC